MTGPDDMTRAKSRAILLDFNVRRQSYATGVSLLLLYMATAEAG